MYEIIGAEVRVKYQDPSDGGAPSRDVHKKMMNDALPGKGEVTVDFSSDFSGKDIFRGSKNLDKDDPNFKWEKIHFSLETSKKARNQEYSLQYEATQNLTDEGALSGDLKSRLFIDKQPAHEDELKKQLDKWVRENVLEAGVLPIKGKYRVFYHNTKNGETVGMTDFRKYYAQYGIGFPDPAHKQYKEHFEYVQERKRTGPAVLYKKLDEGLRMELEELKEVADIYSQQKRDPEAKKKLREVEQRIKQLQGQITDLSKRRKELSEEELEEKETFLKQLKNWKKQELEPEEVQAKMIYALDMSTPESADAKKFIDLIKKYQDKMRNLPKGAISDLNKWIQPAELLDIIQAFVAVADKYDRRLAQKLLPAYIEDMNNRRKELKEKSPEDYASLAKQRNLTWVLNPKRYLEKSEKSFSRGEEVRTERFPEPQSAGAKKVVNMLLDRGIRTPNPQHWLTPANIEVLATSLGISLAKEAEKRMKSPPKGMPKDDHKNYAELVKKEYEEQVNEAEKGFKALVQDLKNRLKEYQKDNPVGHGELKSKKDIDWVNDSDKMKSVTNTIEKSVKRKGFEKELKQTAPFSLEEEKFESMQAAVAELQHDIGEIANTIGDLSLTPEDPGKIEQVRSLRDKAKTEISSIQDQIKNLIESIPKVDDAGLQKKLESKQEKYKEFQTRLQDLDRVYADLTKGEVSTSQIEKDFEKALEAAKAIRDEEEKLSQTKDNDYPEIAAKAKKNLSTANRVYTNLKRQSDILTEALSKVSKPGKGKEEVASIIKKMITSTKRSAANIQKTIDSVKKEKEVPADIQKQLNELGNAAQESKQSLNRMNVALTKIAKAPAVAAAQSMLGIVDYFANLYSAFSRTIWFKNLPEPVYAEDESLEERKTTRKKILELSRQLTGYPLRARDQIMKVTNELRKTLRSFVSMYPTRFASVPMILRKMAEEVEKQEKARMESLLPQDLLHEAEKMLLDLKNDEHVKELKKEFEKLKDEMTKFLRGMRGPEFQDLFDSMTKKWMNEKNLSRSRAREKLIQHFKKIQDSMIRGLIEAYKNRIRDYLEMEEAGEEKPKRSPLGNKPAHEYKRMMSFVEDNIPGLVKESTPTEPSKVGVPTAKELRETIEKLWEKAGDSPETYSREEIMEDLRHELAYSTMMKTDKTKSRTRKKAPKVPPANYTKEIMQKNVKRYLKMDPEDGVDQALADMASRIRGAVKAGDQISVSDAVDALVYGLKTLAPMVKSLSAHPSYTTGRHRTHGDAPSFPGSTKPGEKPFFKKTPPPREFKGTPDFAIDSLEEANKFLKRVTKFFHWINWYINPDWVGLKPSSEGKAPKQPEEGWDFMPKGFWDGLEFLEEEHKSKKASEEMKSIDPEMVLKVCQKVARNPEEYEVFDEFESMLR